MSIIRNNKLNQDGAVWIENQEIYVRDQNGKGIPPSIIPNDNVALIIDGIVYNHIALINSKNIIEVIIKNENKEPSIVITLSDDHLYAYLNFEPGIKRVLKLKDQEPQNSLLIQTEEMVETFNNITKEQIYKKLSEAGVIYGIDEKEIENILKANKKQSFIIAKGELPVKGKDACIEFFFDEQYLKSKLLDKEEDIIDYRHMFEFNSIKENDVIAIKHQLQEGKSGLTIKKTPAYPEPSKDINVVAGKGVTIEEGTIVRALIPGILKKMVNAKDIVLEISPILQIDHDIDMKTGNISFDNDIVINGTVNDSMEVNSLGSVFIKGNVFFAKISAIKNVTILGNVISSKITCGPSQLSGTFLSELKTIDDKLVLILQVIEDLMQKAAFKIKDIEAKGIGVLLKLLLNLKFKDLPQIIINILVNASKGYYGILNDVAFEAFESLKEFSGDCSTIKTIEDIIKIETSIKEKLNKYLVKASENTITISYALNSEMSSDGNVRVIGNGCYNTKIYSKGEVSVNGIFIGGEIFSEKFAKLSQVGSGSGVKSVIGTTDNGRISAKKIFEGNIIKFGRKTYRFSSTEFAIDARFVDNDFALK